MNTHDEWTAEEGEAAAPSASASGADAPLSPRTVIRGERSPASQVTSRSQAALTDWLNVTFPLDPESFDLSDLLHGVAEGTCCAFGEMTDRARGLHGYTRSFESDRGKVLLALGGQRNTALFTMPGEGCALIDDWLQFIVQFAGEWRGRITRWDGAVDDYEGRHTVDEAVELYKAGRFNAGGRRPRCCQYGNWIEPDGSGRTFQVGSRRNGKLIRVYEKGKQLGDPKSPWVRWEVELHNRSREVPWDVLMRPGEYVAGAYPCLDWVSEVASRVRTIRAADSIGLQRAIYYARQSYGPLLNVLMEREGDAAKVVQRLVRPGVPQRVAFSDWYLNKREGDEQAS